MQALVEREVREGVILPRSDDEVATNIRSYTIALTEGKMIGYGALHIHSRELGEIRSLIVSEDARGRGAGAMIVEHCIKEAMELGLGRLLVLTYIPDFFRKLGFEEIEKESIPEHKIWADCIKCIHFPNCNEVSLLKKIKKAV